MGFFKSIKKAFSRVARGVKKVFKKVGEFVGKIMSSKLGKILMIGLTIVSLGSALMAGYTAFSAGMAGGQGVLASLAKGAVATVKSLTGQTTAGAPGAGGGGGGTAAGPTLASTPTPAPTAAPTAAAGLPAGGGGGMEVAATAGQKTGFLSKAADLAAKGAGKFMDYATSPGGGTMLGSVVKGYAEGAAVEEQMKMQRRERERLSRLWGEYSTKTDGAKPSERFKPLDPSMRLGGAGGLLGTSSI